MRLMSTRGRGPAWLAPGLAAALVLGACNLAPRASPSPATPAGTALPASSAGAATGLADALRDALDVDAIVADLDRLQAIADAHGGNRAAGTEGYDASAAFVADELRRAGLVVDLQPVMIPAFTQNAPSTLAIDAPSAPVFEDLRDLKAMLFSASGDVTANVFALGFDPNAQPGNRAGRGCDAADWAVVPAGVIALVQPGQCRRHDAVVLAQAAGALAIVTTYAEWGRDAVRRPTLIEPDDIRIPVLGATHAVGLALARAAADGSRVHLSTATSVRRVSSTNVIGETAGGDPAHVVMLGGHLDSVIDGPGVNDNGSGTMAVLEIAREAAALAGRPGGGGVAWKVRVAFWAGEEIGLFGSAAYITALDSTSAGAIEAYLNFDMIGSANGIRFVYDATGSPRERASMTVAGLFTTALDTAELAWDPEVIGAASDHWPFEQAGIPIGGLYSGADETKSAAQVARFGGTSGAPADGCYHLACDTTANVDAALLEELARAAAWAVGRLASGAVALD
jgi:Zn-dependent M28 family amino/carboxypeptidase